MRFEAKTCGITGNREKLTPFSSPVFGTLETLYVFGTELDKRKAKRAENENFVRQDLLDLLDFFLRQKHT